MSMEAKARELMLGYMETKSPYFEDCVKEMSKALTEAHREGMAECMMAPLPELRKKLAYVLRKEHEKGMEEGRIEEASGCADHEGESFNAGMEEAAKVADERKLRGMPCSCATAIREKIK